MPMTLEVRAAYAAIWAELMPRNPAWIIMLNGSYYYGADTEYTGTAINSGRLSISVNTVATGFCSLARIFLAQARNIFA